jgi:hypothetical protein
VLPLVVVLMLVGFFCAGVGLGQLFGLPSPPGLSTFGDSHRGTTEHGSTEGTLHPSHANLDPSLGVRAKIKVGRAADGSIATPAADPAGRPADRLPTRESWAPRSPSATSIPNGRRLSPSCPSRKGKLIEVNREDHRVATFTVESVETFPKTSFPADRVFDSTDRARLVLVTCGGTWVGGNIGYSDNVIVFATLA